MSLTFHIIGAGRVGQTLAHLWQQSGQLQLSHILRRRNDDDAAWTHRFTTAKIVTQISDLPAADIILISTPDDVIETTAKALAACPWLTPQTLVCHCSGAKSRAALAPLAAKGVPTASLHPVFAFADVDTSIRTLAGHLAAIEAEPAQQPLLTRLAHALGLQPFYVDADHKARYHAALSISANYLMTLAHFAETVLAPLNLPQSQSRALVSGLMQQSFHNYQALGPKAALTGPIVRGDSATVAAHLQALTPQEIPLYQALGTATVALAAEKLSPEQAQALLSLLAPPQA
ncbi:MAG: DUF2520 domain-containing protein [Neisseriaceae bacterium]|nr:DUF2520 domain-containing protein [Neisseriaceae bacterium]MBP6862563.1 DUF2520 domain-containing protein [Neisseriaceae bacterium]